MSNGFNVGDKVLVESAGTGVIVEVDREDESYLVYYGKGDLATTMWFDAEYLTLLEKATYHPMFSIGDQVEFTSAFGEVIPGIIMEFTGVRYKVVDCYDWRVSVRLPAEITLKAKAFYQEVK